jgi:hypothetical protein
MHQNMTPVDTPTDQTGEAAGVARLAAERIEEKRVENARAGLLGTLDRKRQDLQPESR